MNAIMQLFVSPPAKAQSKRQLPVTQHADCVCSMKPTSGCKVLKHKRRKRMTNEWGNTEPKRRKTAIRILLADLKACGRNMRRGKEVHAQSVQSGYDSDIYVASALVKMYANCQSMGDARQVFDNVKLPDVVLWTALISGYANNGESDTALLMFRRMRFQGWSPDSCTFVAALKACSYLALKQDENGMHECRNQGKEIHDIAIQEGYDSDIYVESTLIYMYSKCDNMAKACQVFSSMKHKNVVTWNTLIMGYADNGEETIALDMFTRMRSQGFLPDSWTFVAALKACTSLAMKREGSGLAEHRDIGKRIHNLASENGCSSNPFVQCALIDMYAKFGSMLEAFQVFEYSKHPDLVLWTALILGYVDNGEGLIALDTFRMMRSQGFAPDTLTFVAALKACKLLGALEFGRKIHAEIIDTVIEFNVPLVTSLVDFYAKCGSLVEAQKVFDSHPKTRDLATWSALLAGHSRLGDIDNVFKLFEGMQDAGFQPDAVTFTCILTSCSHAGLLQKGKECFEAMSARYGITPTAEHYTCMVDNFGRSNKLDEAVEMLQSMPCRPDAVAWTTLLGACRKWKNVDIGRLAFQSLMSYDVENASAYVLMAHLYGTRGSQ